MYSVTGQQLEFLTGEPVWFSGPVSLRLLVGVGYYTVATAALQFQPPELVERVLYRYDREVGLPPVQRDNLWDSATWDHVINHIEDDARNPIWRSILLEELSK